MGVINHMRALLGREGQGYQAFYVDRQQGGLQGMGKFLWFMSPALPHTLQGKGRSSVCLRWCSFRLWEEENCRAQTGHGNCLPLLLGLLPLVPRFQLVPRPGYGGHQEYCRRWVDG